jgi:stage V sporulation protein B
MAKKTFMRGAVILAAAGVVIKALGAAFRIPLGNAISDTGMGYYQTAYNIYVMFLVLSNSGIPVAISRMVSEREAIGRHGDAFSVFRVSFILLLCIGSGSAFLCFFRTDFLLGFLPQMDEAAYAVRAIAPALFIVPLMAAYRGYFQGIQNMEPTAKSQIVEQFFRVFSGLTLAFALLPKGEQFAAAGAALGAAVGASAGLVTVMLIYAGHKRTRPPAAVLNESGGGDREPGARILLKIFMIAIPITIGASIMPIMNFIDLAVITNRLSDMGWDADEVIRSYGQLTGFANPLINLPQILTQAVAMSLVPSVAAAWKQNDMDFLRHNIRLGLRTAVIVGLPCAFGMMTLSKQIMLLFFPTRSGAAVNAATFLFILAFGIIFLSVVQTLTGVLQGVGHQMLPVRNLFIGVIVKVAVTWQLIAVPGVDVKGAAIGTVTAYVIAAALNFISVKRCTRTGFDLTLTVVKPMVAALAMSLAVLAGYGGLHWLLGGLPMGGALSTVAAVAIGAAVYVIVVFANGAIREEELAMIPKGERLVKILRKFRKSGK